MSDPRKISLTPGQVHRMNVAENAMGQAAEKAREAELMFRQAQEFAQGTLLTVLEEHGVEPANAQGWRLEPEKDAVYLVEEKAPEPHRIAEEREAPSEKMVERDEAV